MTNKRSGDALRQMPPSKVGKTSTSTAKDDKPIKVIECIAKWDLTICAEAVAPPETHRHEQRTIFVPTLYKFRVSTLVLSTLSPVFGKMLNGPFYEGRASEITLKEDDSQALMILFAVAHHKRELLPKKIPMAVLHQLAVLADKFDVIGVLKQMAERYLEEKVHLCCVKTALFVSWTCGLARQFSASYGVLVCYLQRKKPEIKKDKQDKTWILSSNSFYDDLDDGLGNYLPIEVLEVAIRDREALITRIFNECAQRYDDLSAGRPSRGCEHAGLCTTMKLGGLVRAIRGLYAVFPTPEAKHTPSSVIEVFSDLLGIDARLTSWYEWYRLIDGDESDYEHPEADEAKEMLCTIELESVRKLKDELVQTFEDGNMPNRLNIPLPEVLMRHLGARSAV